MLGGRGAAWGAPLGLSLLGKSCEGRALGQESQALYPRGEGAHRAAKRGAAGTPGGSRAGLPRAAPGNAARTPPFRPPAALAASSPDYVHIVSRCTYFESQCESGVTGWGVTSRADTGSADHLSRNPEVGAPPTAPPRRPLCFNLSVPPGLKAPRDLRCPALPAAHPRPVDTPVGVSPRVPWPAALLPSPEARAPPSPEPTVARPRLPCTSGVLPGHTFLLSPSGPPPCFE